MRGWPLYEGFGQNLDIILLTVTSTLVRLPEKAPGGRCMLLRVSEGTIAVSVSGSGEFEARSPPKTHPGCTMAYQGWKATGLEVRSSKYPRGRLTG